MPETFNLQDELDRKTLDALATLVSEVESGAISRSEADFALRILFQSVSGLVSNEAFDLMSKASAELSRHERFSLRRVFLKGREVVVLEYQYGEACVTLKRGRIAGDSDGRETLRWDADKVATFEHELNPFEAAHVRFNGYADVLLRQGFVEVK